MKPIIYTPEQIAARKAAWLEMCPRLYRETDPKKLPPAHAKVMAWNPGPRGVLITGQSGRGKTRSAYMLLHRVFFEDHRTTMAAFHSNQFAHEVGRRFMDGTGEEWLDNLAKTHVLFLDDLGKSKFTERVECELFGLIEARTANMLPLIVTTNFTGSALAGKMTDDRAQPMIRRLREFCECIAF